MKILILDDDPFVLKLLSIQLKAFGLRHRGFLELVSCEHGAEAVQLLESGTEAVGLVFCDLQMPEMDGIEFVRHLVRLRYRGGLVLMSGEDERILQTAEQMARAHGLNVLGALRKPVFPDMLHRMLDMALADGTEAAAAPGDGQGYTAEDLRHALANGELVNHYQPKLSLVNGEPVGFEAVLRWQHPRDGVLLPSAFLETADAIGATAEICRTMLSTALADAARWQAAGHALHVSANVSLSHLGALDFPDMLAREAATAGVALDDIVLEITESRLLEDPAAQLDVLARLRLKRVRLSIDDYGSGDAGLAQLRDLPFCEVKIASGFVRGVANDASRQAIFESSLGLAQQLRLATVAEGVDDMTDLDYLRRSGCELVQGDLLAAAMSSTQIGPWLQAWPARRDALFG